MPNIQIINPIEYPNWDEVLLTNPDSTFFHTSAWARVLHESYRYIPLYFTIIENGKMSSLIPIMGIKSFITGKRGVSLPFTDKCTPILKGENHYKDVTKTIIDYGKKVGWKYFELRGGNEYLSRKLHLTSFYFHYIDLTAGKHKVFSEFRKSNKRNIKRARKEGVQVVISNTWESTRAFYRLNCMTRKFHGLPPQPRSFFKRVYDHVIKVKKGFVALATKNKKVIAGAVFFSFRSEVIFKYGASDRKYQNLRANNLVMWKAMKWCLNNGFNNLCFGRTETENQGLLQYKRGWGGNEERLFYYKFDLRKGCFVEGQTGFRSSYTIFKILPSPLLRFMGNLLYRHVG